MKYAGRDATKAYEPIHPPDALDKNLPLDKHLGDLDSQSTAILLQEQSSHKTPDELRVELAQAAKPPLGRMLSLRDIEVCCFFSTPMSLRYNECYLECG